MFISLVKHINNIAFPFSDIANNKFLIFKNILLDILDIYIFYY